MTGFHTWLCQAVSRSSARRGATGLLGRRVGGELGDVEPGLERGPLPVTMTRTAASAAELVAGRLELGQHHRVHGVVAVGAVEHQPADVALGSTSSVAYDE